MLHMFIRVDKRPRELAKACNRARIVRLSIEKIMTRSC